MREPGRWAPWLMAVLSFLSPQACVDPSSVADSDVDAGEVFEPCPVPGLYECPENAECTLDERGNPVFVAYPGSGGVALEYDSLGNWTLARSEDGEVTRRDYDDEGRLLRRILPSGRTEEYEYDALGRLILSDFETSLWSFSYFEDTPFITTVSSDGYVGAPDGAADTIETWEYDSSARLVSYQSDGLLDSTSPADGVFDRRCDFSPPCRSEAVRVCVPGQMAEQVVAIYDCAPEGGCGPTPP